MSKCYNKPFLNKVIARIDFTAKYNLPQKGLPKKISDEILKLFPIPEPKEVISKQIHISNKETKSTENKQNHLFYHGKAREKTLCLTPDCVYIEINHYESYDKMKTELITILDKLNDIEEFSSRKFGLRYINNIQLDNDNPLDWSAYLNPNLLAMFALPNNELLSRAFSNIVQQFDDGMLLNFQYGMHNPDFPSKIKRKLFILDFDAYYQGLLSKDDIKNIIDGAHTRIESLYENSITQALRDKMIEEEQEGE